MLRAGLLVLLVSFFHCHANRLSADTRTWDGKWETTNIEVTVVYFVPSDRKPLHDWKDRVDYYCYRIEQFHRGEFLDQSKLKTIVHPQPLTSELSTEELRQGDANAIFFRTMRETDRRLKFAQSDRTAFPILLVLSEINWQPLDDFYRLRPVKDKFEFEGQNIGGQHFPGAAAGGARATYLADRGIGWGLVSADGWRVPYRGSDCVVYHEGCGHTVGLPHPEPIDDSVMGLGQYRGWISESYLNKEQKIRLGWEPTATPQNEEFALFRAFTAVPTPLVPRPGEKVALKLHWPEDVEVKSLRVRYQTAVESPWVEVPQNWTGKVPSLASLGTFDRPAPVSFRIDAALKSGASTELWGYLQVRSSPDIVPQPAVLPVDLLMSTLNSPASGVGPNEKLDIDAELDLLSSLMPENQWTHGNWIKDDRTLISPRAYGSRIELPYAPKGEYRMTMIVEPLDEPNGLILGQKSDDRRFATLFSYAPGPESLSAMENVDGENVGNPTTYTGAIFRKGRLSQVVVTVRQNSVSMVVDGTTIVSWTGTPNQLSLSDYWSTPNEANLFIGAYDCRYRFHRITVAPIK